MLVKISLALWISSRTTKHCLLEVRPMPFSLSTQIKPKTKPWQDLLEDKVQKLSPIKWEAEKPLQTSFQTSILTKQITKAKIINWKVTSQQLNCPLKWNQHFPESLQCAIKDDYWITKSIKKQENMSHIQQKKKGKKTCQNNSSRRLLMRWI